MGRHRALSVAAFLLLLIPVGCKKTVPVVITSSGFEVVTITSKRDSLSFQTPDGDDAGFTVSFPNDAKYPPACAPTTPSSFPVCPGTPVTCTVNPAVSTGDVYYIITPGSASCQKKPPTPIPYSVVRCPRGGC